MALKFIIIMPLIIVISGCQSAVRHYDGVLGYKVISRTNDAIKIMYVDEARREWPNVTSRAQSACAHELSIKPAFVSLSEIDRSVMAQEIDFTIPIPVGTTDSGATKGTSSGFSNVKSSISFNQSSRRTLSLKSLSVECRIKS